MSESEFILKKATLSVLTGILMLVALCAFPHSAYAAEAVSVSIPVEVEGGGTAIVISEVNCPLPERSSVEVANGMTENINIVFSVPGDYVYTIQAETKDELYYSPVYYTAYVSVRTDSSGELTATVLLTNPDSTYKPDVCLFVLSDDPGQETPGGPDDPSQPDTPTQPDVPTQPSKDPPTSRPKTGDDSMLDIYLLICIAASAGLFMLSVIYSVSTERLIGKK